MNNSTAKPSRIAKLAMLSCAVIFVNGCADKTVNAHAPIAGTTPHYLDAELSELARELVDEQRKLASIRQLANSPQMNQQASTNSRAAIPKNAIFAGLETKRSVTCHGCDVKVVAQTIAVILGWDVNSVYEVGRKPPLGVPVNLNLKNQPLRIALEQIKTDAGHIMDLRIDPNFKSMLIEYKNVGY